MNTLLIKLFIKKYKLNPAGLIMYVKKQKNPKTLKFRILYGISIRKKLLKKLKINDIIIIYYDRFGRKYASKDFNYKKYPVFIGKITGIDFKQKKIYIKIFNYLYKTNLYWEEFINKFSTKPKVSLIRFVFRKISVYTPPTSTVGQSSSSYGLSSNTGTNTNVTIYTKGPKKPAIITGGGIISRGKVYSKDHKGSFLTSSDSRSI
ncbi:MAG: hypothetical protein KatS3mg129_2735 [Leptospiraceae bacterium]|nr:MAG: hypothetical protein KatS3mg129_2735 [Leptospiraceae bacterium]